MTAILTLEAVSKRFGAVVVADNFNLSLDAGEALGVIGPNGAGKTSLFNMIAGAIRPDAGRVLFEERDISTLSPSRTTAVGMTTGRPESSVSPKWPRMQSSSSASSSARSLRW